MPRRPGQSSPRPPKPADGTVAWSGKTENNFQRKKNTFKVIVLVTLFVERVRTSKITSSKVKKRTSKVQKEHQKSEHRKFPLKGSERRKIRTTTTTYGVGPMDTKASGGLG